MVEQYPANVQPDPFANSLLAHLQAKMPYASLNIRSTKARLVRRLTGNSRLSSRRIALLHRTDFEGRTGFLRSVGKP